MVKIKGIKRFEPRVLPLDKFFEQKESVTIRPLTASARAEITEIMTEASHYNTKQRKNGLDIDGLEQSLSRETLSKIRKIKLSDGVVSSTFRDEDDKPLAWNDELWDALDDADPGILEYITEQITDITYTSEDDGDPTSPATKGKK